MKPLRTNFDKQVIEKQRTESLLIDCIDRRSKCEGIYKFNNAVDMI